MEFKINLSSLKLLSIKKLFCVAMSVLIWLTALGCPLNVLAAEVEEMENSENNGVAVYSAGDVNDDNDINIGEDIFLDDMFLDLNYLKFTPSKTGIYTFETIGPDTYGYLYNSEKEVITYDDDSGKGGNFKIVYELKAGVTYYWGANLKYGTISHLSANLTYEPVSCIHLNTTNYDIVQPTCTEEGYNAGIYCVDCSRWIHGHETIPITHTDENSDNICELCEEKIPVGNGFCGRDVKWTMYDDGLLMISGSGPMYGYAYGMDWWMDSPSPFVYYTITDVVIGEGITYIGMDTFYDTLKSVTLPSSLTEIHPWAFWGNSPTDVYFYGSESQWSSLTSDFTNFENSNVHFILAPTGQCGDNAYWNFNVETGELTISGEGEMWHSTFYKKNKDAIKSVVVEYGVTSIGSCAFLDCTNLTKLVISDGLTVIGAEAFWNCTSLTDITIPDSVTEIGLGAFANTGYYNDESNWENDALYIGKYLYSAKKSITSCIIREGTKVIGFLSFNGRKELESIEIPDSVMIIDNHAFTNCENLENVIIPNSVTYIGFEAFSGCLNLKSVIVGNSVKSIGEYAFSYCTNLTSITIPDSVTLIDGSAFDGCRNLTDVYYSGTKAQWNEIVIYSGNEYLTNATIHFAPCNHENTEPYPQQDATCTEVGYTAGTYCSDCETWIEGREEIAALGHSFTDYKSDKNATCTADGTKTAKCDNCNTTDTVADTGSALGHTVVTDKAVAPTCTETGLTEGKHCSVCSTVIVKQKTISSTGHTYTSEVTKEPTHLEEGEKTFTCACGDTYTEAIAKLEGHTYTSEVTKEPTHLEEGEKTFTCACGDTYTEAIAKLKGHTYKETVTEPTCTSQGYTTYTCECGDSYKGNYVGTKTHSYTATVTRPATHLSEGIKTYTCSGCGDFYSEKIAKIKEHSYYVSYIVAPTCETEGYTVYLCECDESYNGDIKSATGHDYDGTICKNCGKSKTENCTCNCHKGGFSGLIWKILCFFYKLFGMNKTCSCGAVHY